MNIWRVWVRAMTNVKCACIECEYNIDYRCTANNINLSSANIVTVNEGRKDVWFCKSYIESEYYKELKEVLKKFNGNGE